MPVVDIFSNTQQPTPSKAGNVIIVDQRNGIDSQGSVNGQAFSTVNAAMTYLGGISIPSSGITVWIMPGAYVLSAGISIPALCSMRGMTTQTTKLSWAASAPGSTATLLTMGENTRLEDMSLTLTSTNTTTNLVGISLAGTASNTSKIRGMVLTVDNHTIATGSTTNVYGILSAGTSSLTAQVFSFNFTRGDTINVFSNGAGTKRGLLVSGDNTISLRDTNFYVAAPTDPLSTGSYVAVETNSALSQASFRTSSISGPPSAGGYTGSDILQTLPVLRDTYGINIGPGTDLIHRDAGGLPFALTTTPTVIMYCINAALLGAPRFLWPGVLPTGGDVTEVFVRMDRSVVIQGMSVNMRTAPGAGNNVVFTVNKSTTGVAGSGVATSMTLTISNANTADVNLSSSVTIAAGEYISMSANRSAAGATDISIQLDLY